MTRPHPPYEPAWWCAYANAQEKRDAAAQAEKAGVIGAPMHSWSKLPPVDHCRKLDTKAVQALVGRPVPLSTIKSDGAVITLQRQTAHGNRFLYTVSETDSGGFELSDYRLTQSGWKLKNVQQYAELEFLLEACRPLTRIRNDEINYFSVVHACTGPLVSRLRVVDVGSGGESLEDTDYADDFMDVSGFVQVRDGHLLQPLSMFNGLPVLGFKFGERAKTVVAGVFDVDDSRSFLHANLVAMSTWHSESGGMPVSWSGGDRLESLPGGVLVETKWGDVGEECVVQRLGGNSDHIRRFLVRWVASTESSICAALSLEPLKLPAKASDAETAKWEDRLSVAMSFDVVGSEEKIDAVRRHLRRTDPLYRNVSEALAHPRSARGKILAAALDEVLKDGVLGHLRAAIEPR